MKTHILIVDDEPLARKLIRSHASKIDQLELVGECGNAMDAARVLQQRQVDLMFLDIQMPEVTGVTFASALTNPPGIILTTAHRNFAPEAFDIEAIDYLLKPISFERFFKSVNKFFDRSASVGMQVVENEQKEFVYVRADRKIHKIFCDEIVYVESLDDYVKVHLADKVLVTRESITALSEKLPGRLFVRVHRSFIVNSERVKTISHESLQVNAREIPFGRAFRKSALQQLSVADRGKR